jgi:dTDP-glucose 4,6-dehydratase
MRRGSVGRLYHLSPEKGVRVVEVVRLVCDLMGKRLEDVTRPARERPGQDAAYLIDSTLARNEFGWAPRIALPEGISSVILWINQYWDEISQYPLEYKHSV